MGRRQLTDALRCRRSALVATLRLRTALLLCATNTQSRRAQAALKLCGSLEQRRDLATCPAFTPLNVDLVTCRTSKMESLRSVPLRGIPPFWRALLCNGRCRQRCLSRRSFALDAKYVYFSNVCQETVQIANCWN